MQQKTLIALGALAAIAIAAFLTLRAPDKGERVGPPPRPVPAFKASDVKQLELAANAGKDKVTMKLDGATWKITSPGTWNADQSTVKSVVEQLERIGFGDLVTEKKEKHADLEVSDDKGAHVVARDGGGKVLLDAWLGKSVSGFTMLRPAGKDEVWQASGIFKYAFAKDVASWRDHTVLELKADDVSQLAVEGAGQKLVLERLPAPPAEKDKPPAEAKWKVIESTVKVDPLDDSVANNVVNAIASLRAAAFADDARPADVGLAPAQETITATVKGAKVVLLVGAQKGEDGYLQVQGKPQIYLVQKYTMERVAVAPVNFRDKTLVKVKEADLASVDVAFAGETLSLRHEGAAWKAAKGDVDESKVKPVVAAFENLAGQKIAVGVTPKEAGLDKPTATVTLRTRDHGAVVLKVGAVKDESYYVQKVGGGDVMLVPKWSVERFLKKPADVAKAATAAAK